MSKNKETEPLFNILIKKIKIVKKNLPNTPFYKILQFITQIYTNDKNGPEGYYIIIVFIFKFLLSIILLILPIILTFYSILILLTIKTKSMKYSWKKDKYNFQNTKFDYINKLFTITKHLVFSERIFIYLISCISFSILILIFYFFKYKDKQYFLYLIKDQDFYELSRLNISLFSLLSFIIILYYSIYFNDYKEIYKSNNNINNIYYQYLNKDYIRLLCNHFRDDNNNITSKCYINKMPTEVDLQTYLNNLQVVPPGEKIDLDDLTVNNEETKYAKKILSAIISHQFLIYKYNNKFINDNYYDKCKSIDIDLIMKDKNINDLFLCYNEKTNHPFDIKIDRFFPNVLDLELKSKIYAKYISINNELSKNISRINSSKINETILQIIISIIFIIYLIIFFYLFWKSN